MMIALFLSDIDCAYIHPFHVNIPFSANNLYGTVKAVFVYKLCINKKKSSRLIPHIFLLKNLQHMGHIHFSSECIWLFLTDPFIAECPSPFSGTSPRLTWPYNDQLPLFIKTLFMGSQLVVQERSARWHVSTLSYKREQRVAVVAVIAQRACVGVRVSGISICFCQCRHQLGVGWKLAQLSQRGRGRHARTHAHTSAAEPCPVAGDSRTLICIKYASSCVVVCLHHSHGLQQQQASQAQHQQQRSCIAI